MLSRAPDMPVRKADLTDLQELNPETGLAGLSTLDVSLAYRRNRLSIKNGNGKCLF